MERRKEVINEADLREIHQYVNDVRVILEARSGREWDWADLLRVFYKANKAK